MNAASGSAKPRPASASRQALSEEELKRLHSELRLPLTEHIETCLRQLPQHFPGFQFSTVVNERGWGATVTRDDMGTTRDGKRTNFFSRLEIVVRPFTSYHVLDLAAKGAVRNKEIFNRSHYQRLTEVDVAAFEELVDHWVLEYAELYAART